MIASPIKPAAKPAAELRKLILAHHPAAIAAVLKQLAPAKPLAA